ncbi:MAG: porin [Xanthobacteraceae bacterium]|jgi:Porin subfamily
MHRALPLLALSLIAASVSAFDSAPTLTNPDAKTSPPPPPMSAKSPATGRLKACSAFGAGFVQLPGTDACVKIGGTVTTDVGVH